MITYLIAALIGGLTTPAIAAFVSFVMWENAFKVIGYNQIIRMSIVFSIIAILIALPGWAS